jgi:hypothetical protein
MVIGYVIRAKVRIILDLRERLDEVILKIKIANRTSHRYNRLPLLPSDPGGVQQELVVPVCQRKYRRIIMLRKS